MELRGTKRIRLEYTDESSDKFWELTAIHGAGIEAMDYIATYGKIGTKGQTHRYSFAEAQKKLREKLAKGYSITSHYNLELEDDPVLVDDKYIIKDEPEFDFMEELRKI